MPYRDRNGIYLSVGDEVWLPHDLPRITMAFQPHARIVEFEGDSAIVDTQTRILWWTLTRRQYYRTQELTYPDPLTRRRAS